MAQAAPGRSTLLHAASPAGLPGSDHSFSNTEGDRECCDDSRCKHPGVRPPAIIHYMDHALREPALHSAAGSPQEEYLGTHPNRQPTGCPPPQLSGGRVGIWGDGPHIQPGPQPIEQPCRLLYTGARYHLVVPMTFPGIRTPVSLMACSTPSGTTLGKTRGAKHWEYG